MTEQLTYDPTPYDSPEFTEDEQNSLEVAEKLGQEEAELYAGKYENAEQLEEAYLELQRKLGSGDDDDDQEVDTLDDEDDDEDISPGVSLIAEASEEYYNNEGQLTEETMNKFGEMSSQELVQAFMDIQRANPDAQQPASSDLTDAELNSVYNSVGGEAEYNRITGWAAENLSEDQMDAFNSVVNNGEPLAIQMAVAGLKSEYENTEGYEGRMLTGKAARSLDGFRSQAEVVEAMSDPRYDRDPAYRQDLYDKLERSNVAF